MSKYRKAFTEWYEGTFKNEEVTNQLSVKKIAEISWEAALSWRLEDERRNLESHIIFSVDNQTGQMEVLKWIIEQCEQSNNHFIIDCRCFSNEN